MPYALNRPQIEQAAPVVDRSSILVSSNSIVQSSASLTVDVVSASELCGDMAVDWESLRSLNDSFASPFFSHRFTKVVGDLRPDSKIAVLSRGAELGGFLPFEFLNRTTIEPIGKAFNDAHGLIRDPGQSIDYCDMIRCLGVKSYRFHALAGHDERVQPHVLGNSPSFLANLEAHAEGYVEFLEKTRATIFKQRRKTKKMVKDLGPLRLDLDCRDGVALEQMIQWKRLQYQRSYIFDILSVPWAQQMLRTLWAENSESCRGLLSVLYAGDTMVAAHYGMVEHGILHYWFPVYEETYHQYSPGTAMFLEIAKQSPSLGIKKIDMGYGEQPYKHKFVDTITEMPFGCVCICPFHRLRERSVRFLASSTKRIPGKAVLKKVVRGLWPQFGSNFYQ